MATWAPVRLMRLRRRSRWTSGIEGLISWVAGLFAHDNTHHTMAMAYTLVDCLRADGALDRDAWARARKSFEDHVVED